MGYVPDFSRFDFYDLKVIGGYAPSVWPASFSPYVVRSVIQRVPEDILSKPAVQAIARAMAAGLAKKFEDYDVLGVTVTKGQTGTVVGGVALSPDTYVVDCVFSLRSTQTKKPLGVSLDDLSNEFRSQMSAQRINGTIVTVVGIGSYSCTGGIGMDCDGLDNRGKIVDFWSRPALFEWNGKEAQPTVAFDNGLHGQKFGQDNYSFSIGISDDPGFLDGFPTDMWGIGGGGLPLPNITKDLNIGTIGGHPVTVAHIAIAAMFGLIGWKAYGLWRDR